MSEQPTIGEVIDRYKAIEAHVDAECAKFDEAMKPWKEAMDTMKGYIHGELLRQNLKNFKSEKGTAYLTETLSAKVDNRADFLEFVKQDHWEFLDARVLKEPVENWLASEEIRAKMEPGYVAKPPPGLKTEWIIKCNIRKA
jgi:hypothetical protein